MAIITLTTDMGTRDHYVASVKGAILSELGEATIVDITHEITPFDTAQAAFVLRNCYADLPRGTIHIVGVNPEADPKTVHLIVRHDGHYFIAADNGLFSLLFDGKPHEAFELTMKLDANRLTFPTLQVFAKAACHIARGGTPEVIGRKVVKLKELIPFRPVIEGNVLRGSVIHIDAYGNVLTNVSRELFEEAGKGRTYEVQFGRGTDPITQLKHTYGDAPMGERVAFFGANNMLEIAVNKGVEGSGGGAARLFGLRIQDPVRIEFGEHRRKLKVVE